MPSAKFAKAPPGLSGGGAFFIYYLSSLSLAICLSEGLLIGLNPLLAGISAALAYATFWLLYRYRWASLGFLSAAALAMAYLYAFQRTMVSALANEAWAMGKNLWRYTQGQEALESRYLKAYWLCASIAIDAYAFAFIVIRPRIAALALPFALLITAYWFAGVPSALAMLASLSLALWYWYGASKAPSPSSPGLREDNDDGQGLRLWRRSARRSALLIVLVALSLPALELHTLLAGRFGRLFSAIPGSEKLIEAYGSSRSGGAARSFSFSDTGFQGDAERLGGPVRLVDTPVYRVEGPLPLYLRGSVKARYEGSAWRTASLAPRARKSGSPLFDGADGKADFAVRIWAMNSSYRTIFNPYRALIVASPHYDSFTMDEDGNMQFPDGVYRNEYYELAVASADNPVLAPEALDREGRRRYLELPSGVPGRVRDLAQAVAQAGAQAGDLSALAQALRLRDYLRVNYCYSLDARAAPEGRDFVDFFLFDEKKGYCSYHASALAVMLRAIGIPSRYVEGYIAQRAEEDGSAIVKQRDAHSWVEAYIEPYGWVTLEATPAFPAPDPLRPWPSGSAGYSPPQAEGGLAPSGQLNADRVRRYVSQALKALLAALAIGLALSIILVLPARALHSRLKRARLERALTLLSPERRYCILYLYALELMALSGHGIARGETAREYAARVKARFYLDDAPFSLLSERFEATRYGGHPIDAESVTRLALYIGHVERLLRARLGKPRYFWARYILAKPLPRI